MLSLLRDIQDWYAAQCDGDWEHGYGIKIENIDNPGWRVTIDLTDTILERKTFDRTEREEAGGHWSQCWVDDQKFHGYGDPASLEILLATFITWAKSEPDWLAIPSDTL